MLNNRWRAIICCAGGAVAIHLAHRIRDKGQVKGLILENTFTSIAAMADKLFPFLSPVKPYILRMEFLRLRCSPGGLWLHSFTIPSEKLIKEVKIPILFISGLTVWILCAIVEVLLDWIQDEVVPTDHMESLWNSARSSVAFIHSSQENS